MIGLKICNWVLSTRTFASSDVGLNLRFNFCNLLILVFFLVVVVVVIFVILGLGLLVWEAKGLGGGEEKVHEV